LAFGSNGFPKKHSAAQVVGGDRLAGVTEFFGNFETGGPVGVAVGRGAAPHRGGLAGDLLVAVVGVAVAQAVAGDAVGAGDAAGAQDVVVAVFGLGQSPVRVAGAGELGGGEGLGPVDQLALLRGVDGNHPVPPAFGAHRQSQIMALVGDVRAQLHGLPCPQPENRL